MYLDGRAAKLDLEVRNPAGRPAVRADRGRRDAESHPGVGRGLGLLRLARAALPRRRRPWGGERA